MPDSGISSSELSQGEWLSLRNASAYANAGKKTIKSAIESGEVKHTLGARCAAGREILIEKSSLDAWLERRRSLPPDARPIPRLAGTYATPGGEIISTGRGHARTLSVFLRGERKFVKTALGTKCVAAMVWLAFGGNSPRRGQRYAFVDGNPLNTAIGNVMVEPVTYTRPKGPSNPRWALYEFEEIELLNMLRNGVKQADAARQFGVTQGVASRLKRSNECKNS